MPKRKKLVLVSKMFKFNSHLNPLPYSEILNFESLYNSEANFYNVALKLRMTFQHDQSADTINYVKEYDFIKWANELRIGSCWNRLRFIQHMSTLV